MLGPLSLILLIGIIASSVPAGTRAEAIDQNAVWTNIKQSIVQVSVTGNDSSNNLPVKPRKGAGVIVDKAGVIVTALHVVGQDSEWFRDPDGKLNRQVEITGFAPDGTLRPLGKAAVTEVLNHDAAILYINGTFPAVHVGKRSKEDVSPALAILWDPGSQLPNPALTSIVPTDRSRFGDLLTLNLNVIEGNSGSGVFNSRSELVGIITNIGDANSALAVPADAFAAELPSSDPIVAATSGNPACGAQESCSNIFDYNIEERKRLHFRQR